MSDCALMAQLIFQSAFGLRSVMNEGVVGKGLLLSNCRNSGSEVGFVIAYRALRHLLYIITEYNLINHFHPPYASLINWTVN